MSRKDYVMIAQTISEVIPGSTKCQKVWTRFLAHRIAMAMQEEDARFDKTTFMKACKLDDEAMKAYGLFK